MLFLHMLRSERWGDGGAGLLSRIWNVSVTGQRVVAFLQDLLHQVPGKVVVVWDGTPIHRCNDVKRFHADGAAKRLEVLPFPGYAPELNPAAGVWRWLKRVACGNGCCKTRDEVPPAVVVVTKEIIVYKYTSML